MAASEESESKSPPLPPDVKSLLAALFPDYHLKMIELALQSEVDQCSAEIHRKQQGPKQKGPYQKKSLKNSRRSKGYSRSTKATQRTAWIENKLANPHRSDLDKIVDLVKIPAVKFAELCVLIRCKINPRAGELHARAEANLLKNLEQIAACEQLIMEAQCKQNKLELTANKLKNDASRLERVASRRNSNNAQANADFADVSKSALLTQAKYEEYARLQAKRIPLLRKRLTKLETKRAHWHAELHAREKELASEEFKKMDAFLNRVKSQGLFDVSARMEKAIEQRVKKATDMTASPQPIGRLRPDLFAKLEEQVAKREATAEKLESSAAGQIVRTLGVFPDLFLNWESSVAANENHAKESFEELAKIPGVPISELTVEELNSALTALAKALSALRLKWREVEECVESLRQRAANTRIECDQLQVTSDAGVDVKSLPPYSQGQLEAYRAQLEEFNKALVLLEAERNRLGWRIEVIEEECALMKARLKEVSESK